LISKIESSYNYFTEVKVRLAIPQNTYFDSVEIPRGELYLFLEGILDLEGGVQAGGWGEAISQKSLRTAHFEPRSGPVQPCFSQLIYS
jgi:hypothetical protein